MTPPVIKKQVTPAVIEKDPIITPVVKEEVILPEEPVKKEKIISDEVSI